MNGTNPIYHYTDDTDLIADLGHRCNLCLDLEILTRETKQVVDVAIKAWAANSARLRTARAALKAAVDRACREADPDTRAQVLRSFGSAA